MASSSDDAEIAPGGPSSTPFREGSSIPFQESAPPMRAPESAPPFLGPGSFGPFPGSKLPGSEGEHDMQEQLGTTIRARAFYKHQMLDELNPEMEKFVARQEMMFVGTADSRGETDTSFRAGDAGFVRILNSKTLAYPEYRGNGVLASLGNISENPHASLLFVSFTDRIGLHVNGQARIVRREELASDPAVAALASDEPAAATGKRPECWVIVSVLEAYIHCSKHIPRMQKVDTDISWGTDDTKAKGGDFFKVRASRIQKADPP